MILIGPLKLSIFNDSKKRTLSQLIKQTVGSLIPKQLFKLIVILLGYIVLPIYHVGIFSMRVQHVDESLKRMRIFIYLCVSKVLGLYTGTFFSSSDGRPLIISAAFSAIMIVGAFKFPVTILGIIEASTTLKFSTPITFVWGSTTAVLSEG